MLYLLFLSTDAIKSGNITTKPAQYTFTGVATLISYYGHSVSVSFGDQPYKMVGFSMTITNQSVNGYSDYRWVQSSSTSISITEASTSSVSFYLNSDGYISYNISRGTESWSYEGTRPTVYATLAFTCNTK